MSPNPSATDTTKQPRVRPSRPLPALADRVLLIGLDGATFDILTPMMDQGRMPHLRELIEGGASGTLMSTIPPITPAAWTTFMTGKGPGRHGILDFERYNAKTNELSFNSTYEIKQRTIWQILGDAGLRVGSVQVPMTYPPKPVNGFLITGFETPGTDAAFTYPPELKDQILERWPDFTFKTSWKRKTFGGLQLFKENLAYVKRSFDQGVGLAKYCGERYGWDVMMILYKLVDNLQHKTWKYLDPKTADRDPKRAELCAQCFNHLDDCLGELIEYARSRDATVMLMSDHGHGSLDGKIQANLLLRDWGYLGVQQTAQAGTRTRHLLHRWFSKQKGKFAASHGIEHDLALDWSSTRAFVAHAGMCGFLYLNLEGRQETGIVEPADYETTREQLADRLLQATARDAGGHEVRLFDAVHKPEELYHCERDDQPWLPDLLLVPTPGLVVVRKIRGAAPVLWSKYRKLEGTHRMEGVLAANGPHIRKTTKLNAQMADMAPTLLAALGLRVPDDMEGRVVEEMFSTPPSIELESPKVDSTADPEEQVYDEREQEVLTQRLTDLGYLE